MQARQVDRESPWLTSPITVDFGFFCLLPNGVLSPQRIRVPSVRSSACASAVLGSLESEPFSDLPIPNEV